MTMRTPEQLDRLAMDLGAWHTAMDRLIQRVEREEEEDFKADMKHHLRLTQCERTAKRA